MALLHDDSRLHHVDGGLAGPRAPSPRYLLLPPSNGRRREASCACCACCASRGRQPGWNPAASMTLRPIVRRIVRAWAAEAGGAPIFVFGRWRGSPQRLRGNLEGTLPCRSHWREAPATCDLRPAMLSRTLPITARPLCFFLTPGADLILTCATVEGAAPAEQYLSLHLNCNPSHNNASVIRALPAQQPVIAISKPGRGRGHRGGAQ